MPTLYSFSASAYSLILIYLYLLYIIDLQFEKLVRHTQQTYRT